MNDEPLALIEHEVKSWPDVTTGDTGRVGRQPRYAKAELGRLHGSSFADLPFPKKVRNATHRTRPRRTANRAARSFGE